MVQEKDGAPCFLSVRAYQVGAVEEGGASIMRFELPISGRAVRIGSMKLWFYLAVRGRIYIGKEGRTDYYAFKCSDCNAVKMDIGHGYENGEYFLRCPDCGYKLLCGDRL
jgi:hypothetical protein